MPTNINIARLAQPKIRVTEIHLAQLPELPRELRHVPGFAAWWRELKLMRERDQEAFNRLLLNRESNP